MGREIKRVPIGFDWPIGKIWKGYVCPIDPAHFDAHEAWEPEEPPTGEAWQLWETVSDGSPISPVFTTPEDLIDWMSQPDPAAEAEGRGAYPSIPWAQGHRREHAEAFVRGPGWSPTMIFDGRRLMGGVEACFAYQIKDGEK